MAGSGIVAPRFARSPTTSSTSRRPAETVAGAALASADQAEKDEFVELFTDLLERSYSEIELMVRSNDFCSARPSRVRRGSFDEADEQGTDLIDDRMLKRGENGSSTMSSSRA